MPNSEFNIIQHWEELAWDGPQTNEEYAQVLLNLPQATSEAAQAGRKERRLKKVCESKTN